MFVEIAGVNPNIHLQTEPEPGAISPPVVLPGAPGEVELNPLKNNFQKKGWKERKRTGTTTVTRARAILTSLESPSPTISPSYTPVYPVIQSPPPVSLVNYVLCSAYRSSPAPRLRTNELGLRLPLSRRERAKCDGISVLGAEARLWRSC